MTLKTIPPVTTVLIAISIAVAVLSRLGSSPAVLAPLFIGDPNTQGFQAVLSGEVWRLITPIFIHFGIIHLLFNMLWLWDLGLVIEQRKGYLFLMGFVFVVGIISNIAQFILSGSPFFGGMSGVVYGLLGYIWIHGRRNPLFGITLHKHIVVMMLAWFVLCWFGIFGPIANWAHTFGLGMGIALGFLNKSVVDLNR
jgi:membrane associated rhomboid family serine protease